MIGKNTKADRARVGLLLIASPRFKDLGEGLNRGTYYERKQGDVSQILGTLRESLDVVFPGIIFGRQEAREAMDTFYRERVDFVVAEFLSWSEDFAWIRFLRDMPEVPMLFVNPAKHQMTFSDTEDEDDFIDFLCAGTLVGSLEGAGSIPRIGRKNVKVVVGNREHLVAEILCFSRAARVRSILREAVFGLLANYNELMWSTYVDPYNLFARIGPEFHFISYTNLADEIAQVEEKEVIAYKEELSSMYRIMSDVEDDKFFASVKASIGIARVAEKRSIDAMIFNDLDPTMFKLVGLRPGFYHPSLNENLSVLVPEADLGGGLITFIMKVLTKKHVNFIEPFHIELADNTFAGGHAGPNDHNVPDYKDNVIIARDVRFAKTNYKYAGAPFAWYRISPGVKTMAQLTENNGTYKLVCALVESMEGDHILASYSHSIFKPAIPVNGFFEKIIQIGTTQHFAVVDGDVRKELKDLSAMMDFKYYEIS